MIATDSHRHDHGNSWIPIGILWSLADNPEITGGFVNVFRHHRRVVSTFVAAALFLTACGGGDDGATSGDAPADAAVTEAIETEFDLVQDPPADRETITEAMDPDGIHHVWEGPRLTVLQTDEDQVVNYLETMTVDDVPDEGGDEGVKNRKLKKAFKKVTKSATKVAVRLST
jgi:hypothetical protein